MVAAVRLGPLAWLAGAALAGLAAALAVALPSPLMWAVPAVALVGLGLAIVRPSPVGWLGIVLALQVFQLGGERGTAALEVIAGLALVGYIGAWYALAILARRRVVTSLFDVAAVTWGTVGLAAAAVLGQLFGADAYDFRADVLATLPFLLYLPVKDTCARNPRGVWVVLGVIVLFGLVATVQSVRDFRRVISGATALWEIADARFTASESAITAALLLSTAALTIVRGRARHLLILVGIGFLLGGLILTKSRGYWVAALLGLLAMGVFSRGEGRRRMATALVLGSGLLLAAAFVFFTDQIVLVATGSANRLLSLASAGQDISLLNRFAETRAAWEMILHNPVLGYGWGVQVSYYGLISQGTVTWAFLHNGYVALWLKTGLWGLLLMLTVWGGAITRGAATARDRALAPALRIGGLGAAATLSALTLSAITSNPFSILDQMFIFTLMVALAHGAADHAAWHMPVAVSGAEPGEDAHAPVPSPL